MRWAIVIALLVAFAGCTCRKSENPSPSKAGPARPQGKAGTANIDKLVALPRTEGGAELTFTGVPVVVSRDAVYAGSNRQRIFAVPAGDQAVLGFATANKPGGAPSLGVPDLAAALEARRKENGRALLFFDEATPYRLVVETIYAVDKAGFMFWSIVGRNDRGDKRVILSSAPGQPAAWLYFSGDGARIETGHGFVAAGCNEIGEGVALPSIDKLPDLAELKRCLGELPNLDHAITRKSAVAVAAEQLTISELARVLAVVKPQFPRIRLAVTAPEVSRSLVAVEPPNH